MTFSVFIPFSGIREIVDECHPIDYGDILNYLVFIGDTLTPRIRFYSTPRTPTMEDCREYTTTTKNTIVKI